MKVTDQHTFYLWTGTMVEADCQVAFEKALLELYEANPVLDFRGTDFLFKIIPRPGGNYGFLHVLDSHLYNLIKGDNADGTARTKITYPCLSDLEDPVVLPENIETLPPDEQWEALKVAYGSTSAFYRDELWNRYDQNIRAEFLPTLFPCLPFRISPATTATKSNVLICWRPGKVTNQDFTVFLARWSTGPANFPKVNRFAEEGPVFIKFSSKTNDAVFAQLFNQKCEINGELITLEVGK